MKILITGICGFVGFEVAISLQERLARCKPTIIGLDNLSRNGSHRNLYALKQRGISVQHGDVRLASDLEQISSVDCVIDASADASVLAGSVDGSRRLVENNLYTTINLLELCKHYRSSFVLLSTSRVYSIRELAKIPVESDGNAFVPKFDPIPLGLTEKGIGEDFSTDSPISMYGATKLASERMALEYGECYQFPVWINRCGVMSGAGQFGKADQGIFSYWLHSWREGRPLKYLGFGGSGHQVRDCLHPSDLAELIAMQIQSNSSEAPKVVNVSGGAASSMSLCQLSAWCSDRWGSKHVDSDTENRRFDLPWIVLDHSLATESWQWVPEKTTNQILAEIADFADSQKDWIAQTS